MKRPPFDNQGILQGKGAGRAYTDTPAFEDCRCKALGLRLGFLPCAAPAPLQAASKSSSPPEAGHPPLDFGAASAELALLPRSKLLPLAKPEQALDDAAGMLGRQAGSLHPICVESCACRVARFIN